MTEERHDIARASMKLSWTMEKIVQELGGEYSVEYDSTINCWVMYYHYSFNKQKHTTMLTFDYTLCCSKYLRDTIVQRLYASMCNLFLDAGKEM